MANELEELLREAGQRIGREELPADTAFDPANEWNLTSRETEVLRLVVMAMSNRQISRELNITENTAGVHVSNILRKLGAGSRVEAASIVAQRRPTGN